MALLAYLLAIISNSASISGNWIQDNWHLLLSGGLVTAWLVRTEVRTKSNEKEIFTNKGILKDCMKSEFKLMELKLGGIKEDTEMIVKTLNCHEQRIRKIEDKLNYQNGLKGLDNFGSL